MHLRLGAQTPFLYVTILSIISGSAVWASSVCEILVEAPPDYASGFSGSIWCSGDEVRFAVPSSYSYAFGQDRGSAVLIDDYFLNDELQLLSGEDVTLTRVSFRSRDYISFHAFTISNCRRCIIRDAAFSSLSWEWSVNGGVPLRVTHSSVTLEGGAFTDLGWHDSASGGADGAGSSGLIVAVNSSLTLRGTAFADILLRPGRAVIALGAGGALHADGASWQRLTLRGAAASQSPTSEQEEQPPQRQQRGRLVAASDGAEVVLRRCTVSGITDNQQRLTQPLPSGGVEGGDGDALFYVGSGASVDLGPDNRLYVSHDAAATAATDTDTGANGGDVGGPVVTVILGDGAGPISWPDESILRAGDPASDRDPNGLLPPHQQQPPTYNYAVGATTAAEAATGVTQRSRRSSGGVVLYGHDGAAAPLRLGRVALALRGASDVALFDMSLLRLEVVGGSAAALGNVSFVAAAASSTLATISGSSNGTGSGRSGSDALAAFQRPLLRFTGGSSGTVSGSVFRSLSAYSLEGDFDDPAAAGLVLDVTDNSSVTVSNCAFEGIAWWRWSSATTPTTAPYNMSMLFSPESQVIRVATGSILHLRNSSFSAIGGSGTVIRALDSGSGLHLDRVNITDIDLRVTAGERRATLVVARGAFLTANKTLWARIDVGTSSGGAALDAGDAAAVSLEDCTFADIASPAAPAVQLRRPTEAVRVVGCVWRNVCAESALWLEDVPAAGRSAAAAAVISDTEFGSCGLQQPVIGGAGYAGSRTAAAATATAVLGVYRCGSAGGGAPAIASAEAEQPQQQPLQQQQQLLLTRVTFTDGPPSSSLAAAGALRPVAAARLRVAQCDVAVENSTFQGNAAASATGAGAGGNSGRSDRAVHATDGSRITFTAVQFLSYRGADFGGAVLAESGTSLHFRRGCAFTANSASVGGGAVALLGACAGTFEDVTFVSNSAQTYGGALYGEANSSLTVSGCTFAANNADGAGGAIALRGDGIGGGSVTVVGGSNLTRNTALYGGGVYCTGGANVNLLDSSFTANSASDYGGAVFFSFATAAAATTATTAGSGSGSGGDGGGSLTLRGSILTGNTAVRGGALCVDCDRTAIGADGAGSSSAGGSGGGGSAAVRFTTDVKVAGESSAAAAAYEYAQKDQQQQQMVLLQQRLDTVIRSADMQVSNCTFALNACTGDADVSAGGAAHVNGGRVAVRDCSFVSNTCPSGGALAFGARRLSSSGIIGGNSSSGGVGDEDWVAVTGCNFRLNRGGVRGGAVSLLDVGGGGGDAALYGFLYNNSFSANSAGMFGGAVNALGGWAVDLLENDFNANGKRATTLYGGAVYLAQCRKLRTDQSGYPNVVAWRNNFTGNLGGLGGAVYTESCNLTSFDDRYTGNQAAGSGGAVHSVNTAQGPLSTLQLYDTLLERNTARASGGGVLAGQQGLGVVRSLFVNNSARVAGGAIMILEASPAALLVLQRTAVPYYSEAEYEFLRADVLGSTFRGNTAWSGGGAVYADGSRLLLRDSAFERNTAGDGIPNDEWSDSGGAIFVAQCFGLSEINNSTFTGNEASGGPGGAILQAACSLALLDSSFSCNSGSTFGGAIAAGNWRDVNSTAYDTPTLNVQGCNFTDNVARLYDGGAVLAREVNATAMAVQLRGNRAGRSGGAVALLNSLGSGFGSCVLEANHAAQHGGGIYALSVAQLSVQDCAFSGNVAELNGGAFSSVDSSCVLTARSSFTGNYAGGRGGAVQLQLPSAAAASDASLPYADGGRGDSSCGGGAALAAVAVAGGGHSGGAPCLGRFLREVNAMASPLGIEMLGLTASVVRLYNATLVYGNSGTYFARGGGALLATPNVKGPAPLLPYDLTVVPEPQGSVVQLAQGSSLALVNWARLRLQADAASGGTRLVSLGRRLDAGIDGYDGNAGAAVHLARGSALTALRADMELLPAGGKAVLSGSLLLVGADLTPYTPNTTLPVLSVVLSFWASIAPSDRNGGETLLVRHWNRYIIRFTSTVAAAGEAFLLDTFTGATRQLTHGSQLELASSSVLLGHSATSIALSPDRGASGSGYTGNDDGGARGGGNVTTIRVMACDAGGDGAAAAAWRLGNGTELTTGGSLPAVSAVPAAGSIVWPAADSSMSVRSWGPYIVRLQCSGGGVRLEYPSRAAGMDLGTGIAMSLQSRSVILTPPDGVPVLPRGVTLTVQGANWDVGGSGGAAAAPLSVGGGNIAMGIVLPADSVVRMPDGSTIVVQDWNRYVLWAGPMGTLLYDVTVQRSGGVSGGGGGSGGSTTVLQLEESTAVTLSRATPLVRHDSAAAAASLPAGLTLTITEPYGSWALGDGTNITLPGGSKVALTLILAPETSVVLPDGTTIPDLKDWLRYLLVTSRTGAYLYDTAAGVTTPLPAGTRVTPAKGSAVLVHDSFAAVLQDPASRLVVKRVRTAGEENVVLELDGKPLPGASAGRQVVVLPADGSRLVFDGPGDGGSEGDGGGLLVLDGANTSSRFVPWVGANGSYLYDAVLLATLTLTPNSTLRLAPGSSLLVHDSRTTVLSSEMNFTAAAPGGDGNGVASGAVIWSLSNGTTLTAGGSVVGLAAAPAGSSRILYDRGPRRIPITDSRRYSLQAGRNGTTTLYDTLIDASYIVADGSTVSLSNRSFWFVGSGNEMPFPPSNLTVWGGRWRLDNGTTLDPGDGIGSSNEFLSNLHVPSLEERLPGELGRLCSVDLTTATYDTDPYMYDNAAAKAFLSALSPEDFTRPSTYGAFARAAYGFGPTVDVSDFNASLLLASGSLPWDPTGRPSIALVTCTVTTLSTAVAAAAATAANSAEGADPDAAAAAAAAAVAAAVAAARARDISVLQLGLRLVNNTAGSLGGGMYVGGGRGGMLLDGLQVNNNTVLGGDGGGLALSQGEDQRTTEIQMYVVSSNFSANNASSGSGGAVALAADDRHQQVTFLDTTLRSNTAASGGALALAGRVSVLLNGSLLEHNRADPYAGATIGVVAAGGATAAGAFETAAMTPGSFSSSDAGNGGSILASYCNELQLTAGTRLYGNTAAAGRGGGLAARGCALLLLYDATVEQNSATSGGGVYIWNDLTANTAAAALTANTAAAALTANTAAAALTAASFAAAFPPLSPLSPSLGSTTVSSSEAVAAAAAGLDNNGGKIGGSIALVIRSALLGNSAAAGAANVSGRTGNSTAELDLGLEGIGGSVLLRGRVSTLLADSHFRRNSAASQGGSIFLQSVCDLTPGSQFLVRRMDVPTAFASAAALLPRTLQSLQWPRPKGCWGTVIYMPHFYNNEAIRSGGALFASHPEALSLVCRANGGENDSAGGSGYDYNGNTLYGMEDVGGGGIASGGSDQPKGRIGNLFSSAAIQLNESGLADKVLTAMKKASYQVLDNRIVQICYRDEIQRIFNRSLDQLSITGLELSTLGLADNRALGYGYLIAIVPSQLQLVNVSWSASAASVNALAPPPPPQPQANLQQQQQQQTRRRRRRRQLASSDPDTRGSDDQLHDSAGAMPFLLLQSNSLTDKPLFSATVASVYDQDVQEYRAVFRYHLTTASNKPMDIAILLLDALGQIASENTTLRQAQVRARLREVGSAGGVGSGGCQAELLGGLEATARNGSALLAGLRLRALKGESYTIEFGVEDAVIQGTMQPLLVNVTVPPCGIGEVPRDGGYICQKCDQRTFSLWQDMEPLVGCAYPNLYDITCYPCPDGAECLGGAVVVPRPGFWHSAANSTLMIACPNPEACRDGDDDAQAVLIACQQWWYSRPLDFNYSAVSDTVLMAASLGDDSGDECVVWGLPYNHPASYMQKQCAEGYTGNLCAVCAPVNGVMYADGGDFECGECFSQGTSATIAVFGFLANLVTVLLSLVLTFMSDYTEDEELAMGDILKVLIVHMQYLIIVTRLNIPWPSAVSSVSAFFSACTGALSKVYAPSCLLDPATASPGAAAAANQLTAILAPLVTTFCVTALWMLVRTIFNFNTTQQTKQALDMRTIDEYKADRARRVEERKRVRELDLSSPSGLSSVHAIQEEGPDDLKWRAKYGGLRHNECDADVYTDLRASQLLDGAASGHSGGGGGDGGGTTATTATTADTQRTRKATHDDSGNGADDGNGNTAGGGGRHFVTVQPELAGPQDASMARLRELRIRPMGREGDKDGENLQGGANSGSNCRQVLRDENAGEHRPSIGLTLQAVEAPQLPQEGVLWQGDREGGMQSPAKARLPLPPPVASSSCGGGTAPTSPSTGVPAPPAHPPTPATPVPVKLVGIRKGTQYDAVVPPARGRTRPSAQVQDSGVTRAAAASDDDPERGESGGRPSEEAAGGGAAGGGSSGRKPLGMFSFSSTSGGRGGSGRKASGRLLKTLTQGSMMVRSFFTYNEEAIVEGGGQVRWAALATIHRSMAWWRQMLLVVMIACFVLYPAWAQATLQIFACYYLDDGSGYYPQYQLAQAGSGYWILNMNQECYNGEHARIWVPIGIVGVFLVCLGIPLLTLGVTWTHRTALRTVHVVQTYGFLYKRYNYEQFYWWEAAMQAQTLMLVVVEVFGRVLAPYQQATLLMLALVAIMWSNLFFQPMKHKLLDRLSSLSLAALSGTVALGLLLMPPADQRDPVTTVAANAIVVIMIVLNATLLVYILYVMWGHGRNKTALGRALAAASQRFAAMVSRALCQPCGGGGGTSRTHLGSIARRVGAAGGDQPGDINRSASEQPRSHSRSRRSNTNSRPFKLPLWRQQQQQ